MSKNITEMSFDDIFPETPFPKPASSDNYPGSSQFDDYRTDDTADWENRYTSADDFSEPPANRTSGLTDFPPPPESTAQSEPAPFPPSGFSQNNPAPFPPSGAPQDNSAPLPPSDYPTQLPPVPPELQNIQSQFQSGNTTNSSATTPQLGTIGVVCAFFAFFTSSSFPLGIILGIVAIILATMDKKAAADKGLPVPKTNRLIISVAAVAIIGSLLVLFTRMVIPMIS